MKGLRSQDWFDRAGHPGMSAPYLERYVNWGLSLEELRSSRPIIGIAQTGSDLSPCNRHHLVLAERIREGIRDAGGVPLEFPVHPIQETGRRPTAALDRNLAYLGLVEILHGYPIDGVVLTTGCDKTTPACLMAAATVDIPSIVFSGGPMLNGWYEGKRVGSGTAVWQLRDDYAAGKIDEDEYTGRVASLATSSGHCNSMGTASTMNSLAEALGMSLPGCASIPAPHRERGEMAYSTGSRIVEMVREDLKPSDILTRDAFVNAIVVNSAIGGSTNATVHLSAVAQHIGISLPVDDWEAHGYAVPLLVNMQPAGEYLGEDFHRAGGVRGVIGELMRAHLIVEGSLTVNGLTIGDNCRNYLSTDSNVISSVDNPLTTNAGFIVLRGNMFDSAIMKTSGISESFRDAYLEDPEHPGVFDGELVVFEGPEDYSARIDDSRLRIGPESVLLIRGVGPIGFPGSSEVVNMRPPKDLVQAGVHELPCMGDGRQSGTSGAPSILHISPEAAVGGTIGVAKTGDRIRIDLVEGRVDLLLAEAELAKRRLELKESGGYGYPDSQTPWQEIQRTLVSQLSEGMVLELAVKYRGVGGSSSIPRDNH